MGHVALYREWRPRRFDEVVGQEHVVRTLANAIAGRRLAHAYLFCGPRGTGKTSVARLVARAANCGNRDGVEPCNVCQRCQAILDGSHLDIVEIDAASNRGIDEIRDLRERVRYSPTDAEFKVYIIDEVHMLTPEAFNALLKTLEEPPARVLFIMATTESHKLPLTILSRCQRFDFHRLSEDQIAGRVQRAAQGAGISADPGAVRLIARVADGSLRDALSVLDQAIVYSGGDVTEDAVARIAGAVTVPALLSVSRAISGGDVAAALAAVSGLIDGGADPAQLLRALVVHWRDILVIGAGSADVPFTPEDAAELRDVHRHRGLSGTLRFLDILATAESQVRFSSSPRVLLDIAVIRAAGSVPCEAADRRGEEAAPPPAPARVAPRALTSQPGEPPPVVNLEDVFRVWEEVRTAAADRQKPLVVRLNSVVPAAISDGKLRLIDKRSGNWEPQYIDAIQDALYRVLGVRLTVEVSTESRAARSGTRRRPGPSVEPAPVAPAQTSSPRPEPPAPLPEPPPAHESETDASGEAEQASWLEQASDILGGTIISAPTRKGG